MVHLLISANAPFHYQLLFLCFPNNKCHQYRHQSRPNPEVIDVSEIVGFHPIHHLLITLDEQTTHDVLDACTDIAGNTYHSKGCTRSVLWSNIHCHQTAQEAKQDTNTQSEQDHCRNVNPCMMTRNQQEQTKSQGIQQAEYNCWQIAIALEHLIRQQA